MRLIIGGKAQGKKALVLKEGQYAEKDFCDGALYPLDQPVERAVLTHFHLLVRRWLESGRTQEELEKYLQNSSQIRIIICNEIGSGIVPISREEEQWRETTGRLCCKLAEKSEQVDRVFCGIPMRIKG